MVRFVDAIFENGVLRPVESLDLAQGQRVHLAVSESEVKIDDSQVDPDRAAALARLVEYARTHSFTSTGPYPRREELYDRGAGR